MHPHRRSLPASCGYLASAQSRAGRARGQRRDQGSAAPRARVCERHQLSARLSLASRRIPVRAEAGGGGVFGERACSGKDGRRVWAPESRVGWRTGRERPDAHLWVTLGSHRAAEEGPRGPPCVPGAPAPGTRKSCGEAEGPGSELRGPPTPIRTLPRWGARPRTPPTPRPASPTSSRVPYLGPGLGGQEDRELARPAAHGLRPIGVHEQHHERGRVRPVLFPSNSSFSPGHSM